MFLKIHDWTFFCHPVSSGERILTSWDREQLLFSLLKMSENTHLTQDRSLQIRKRRKPE